MTDADGLLRRFLLALAVYREARGESALGKLLVAQVIENRVHDRRWPDTYRDVILQPWQFSAFNKSDPQVTVFPKEGDTKWQECVDAADQVLRAPFPFTSANHYHTHAVSPDWKDDQKIVAVEGGHIFYRL